MDDAEYVIFESSPPPVNWALNGFRLGSAPIASDIAETLQTVTLFPYTTLFRSHQKTTGQIRTCEDPHP